MPLEKDNILEFNQYMKPDKMPYINYADIESLIFKKMDECANNVQQQNLESIFLVYLQFQLYGLLII